MLVKIYWWAWGLCITVALLLIATGNFTMLAAVAFGFISFGLTFMGMMSVLPATIAHPELKEPEKLRPAIKKTEKIAIREKEFGILKSA